MDKFEQQSARPQSETTAAMTITVKPARVSQPMVAPRISNPVIRAQRAHVANFVDTPDRRDETLGAP